MTASSAISNGAPPTTAAGGSDASCSSASDGFALAGPSVRLDSRINAYRGDLADIILAGRVLAPHYARALIRACGSRPAYVRTGPNDETAALSELLPGEAFAVLEYAGGWAWGQCAGDRVVGYVEAIALTDAVQPTHIVCEKWAPVAPDPRVTAPVLAGLPMGARLNGYADGACLATEYGCVPMSHLRSIDDPETDPVTVAERLIGVPWRDGGRGPEGIDAAGLVQLALGLCGIAAPRFLDLQRTLGRSVPDGAPLRRGDLVISGEAAGLMIDDLMLIHASREAGKVTASPAAAFAGPDTARRRLDL